METLSINYAKKLLAIRCAEGLTQKEFAKITGVSLSAVKIYESGHRPARFEIMEKVLQKKLFQKYTLWLLHDEIVPELGQCAANLTNKKPRRIKLSKKEKTQKKLRKKGYYHLILKSL
ncbi:MAG: helix-turn-helix domain-containing protein [Candidatus Arsenophonus phytopathogenicus]